MPIDECIETVICDSGRCPKWQRLSSGQFSRTGSDRILKLSQLIQAPSLLGCLISDREAVPRSFSHF